MTTSRQGNRLDKPTVADGRVAEQDRRRRQAETLLDMVDDALPNVSHARRTVAFARHRRHRLVAGAGADVAERQQVRTDVEEGPVPADPVAHRHADAADHALAGPD